MTEARRLTNKQIEERRRNLKAFRKELEMEGDQTFNTTLQMQEEWLATVDALQEREEEGEGWEGERDAYITSFDETCTERDRYKALLEAAPMALFSSRNIPEKRIEWFRRYNAWRERTRAAIE